ncbi:MAG: hypothetical protein ABSE69_15865, partial [Roseiarcus sp.]
IGVRKLRKRRLPNSFDAEPRISAASTKMEIFKSPANADFRLAQAVDIPRCSKSRQIEIWKNKEKS